MEYRSCVGVSGAALRNAPKCFKLKVICVLGEGIPRSKLKLSEF
jgi:hypothetical protein